MLQQRLADALREPAVHLAVANQRVNNASDVVNDHVANCFVRAEVQREIDAAF